MAIYHFSGQTISRSCGRSSVGAASYRAAERIIDERTGFVHDFRMKEGDVFYKDILLAKGAPKAYQNRDVLWNAVEKIEKRKDAQLAREFNIALPRELSIKESIALMDDFVKEAFVDNGMIADLTCHRGEDKATGERQPHAHVMLTMREVSEQGFGLKVRAWNQKALLLQWREGWAEKANHHLHQAGIAEKIDHRSLAAQGIDLLPQTKIGPKEARYHQDRQAHHEAIARANGQKLLEDPSIAWDYLTRHQSSFTQRDLARLVHRQTADREQFNGVYQHLLSSKDLIALTASETSGERRFTTQRLLDLECDLMDRVGELAHATGFNVKQHTFRTLYPNYKDQLTPTQYQALAHVFKPQRLSCITGLAGTGKSHLLKMAHETWRTSGYTVKGATLSGIAAENLEEVSGIASQTVASFLRQLEHPNVPTPLDHRSILVLDEAGMLDLPQMGKLMAAVDETGAKAVILQDPEQLPAIGPGAPARAIADTVGMVALTDIQRQCMTWQRQATYHLGTQQTRAALDAYAAHGYLHPFHTQGEAKQGMVDHWARVIDQQPLDQVLMLAYTRQDVAELNQSARQVLLEKGRLGEAKTIETDRGVLPFALGERVYFGRNEYHKLQVKNGSVGQVTGFTDEGFTVRLDKDGREVTVNPETYSYVQYGYATTIYKSQGKTVDRTFVLTSTHLNRHSTYVALSRHRHRAEIFYSKETFLNEACLTDHLSRAGQKTNILEHAVPSRTSAWLDQEPANPSLELNALIQPSQAALDYLEHGYEAYKEAERDKTRHELQRYQHDFETQHPKRAKALQWEMFEVLSITDQAKLLKESYMSLAKETSSIDIGEKDHPLYEKIHALIDEHSSVIDYWNKHDRSLIDHMQGVLDKGNTEPPEPEPQIEREDQTVEKTHERQHQRDYCYDFEMEL